MNKAFLKVLACSLSMGFVFPAWSAPSALNQNLLQQEQELVRAFGQAMVDAELHSPEHGLMKLSLSGAEVSGIKSAVGPKYFSQFRASQVSARRPIGVELRSGSATVLMTMISPSAILLESGGKKVVWTPSFEVSRDFSALEAVFVPKKLSKSRLSIISEAHADVLLSLGILAVVVTCGYFIVKAARKNFNKIGDAASSNLTKVGNTVQQVGDTVQRVGDSVSGAVTTVADQSAATMRAAETALNSRTTLSSELDSITPAH